MGSRTTIICQKTPRDARRKKIQGAVYLDCQKGGGAFYLDRGKIYTPDIYYYISPKI